MEENSGSKNFFLVSAWRSVLTCLNLRKGLLKTGQNKLYVPLYERFELFKFQFYDSSKGSPSPDNTI